MQGALALLESESSRVFTQTRYDEFRRKELIFRVPRQPEEPLRDYVTDTGLAEPPSWLQSNSSPVDEVLARAAQQTASALRLTKKLLERIVELKRLGAEEELPWSKSSEDDFWDFVSLWPGLSEPGLILLDNGNLRAVWRNNSGEQVALEFKGDRKVLYVIFSRRRDENEVARRVGEASFEQIVELIELESLGELLRGEG